MWSEFTKNNIHLFKKKFINNNNILLINIKKERDNIIHFIKNNTRMKITIESYKIFDNKINKYGNSPWVDPELFNNLDELNEIYKISWGSNKIIVKTSNINFLKRIKTLIYIIEYLKVKNNINKNVKIYLVLSSLQKKLPNENEIISPCNINSGYTDLEKNIIFIWRLEEFEKVIFHEIMHYFDMDLRHHHTDVHIDINGPHSYYEAITDFYGIFYNIIYISLLTKISIKELLEVELSFIKNQAVMVNNFFNLYETDKIVQKSPAYSYYILKYMIFKYYYNNDLEIILDYNTFLKKCIKKITSIKFINTNSARMSLLELK